MTAINAALLPDAIHIFSDGMCIDDEGKQAGMTGKVFFLPVLDAVLAWSGPILAGPALAVALEWQGRAIEHEAPRLAGSSRFSAMLFRLDPVPNCTLVETGGAVRHLFAGQTMQSVTVAEQFDVADMAGSGLAMMEAQRSCGPVGGFCQHSVLDRGGFRSRILARWE